MAWTAEAHHATLLQNGDTEQASRFLAELRKAGVDVSDFCQDPNAETPERRATPARYDGGPGDASGATPGFRGASTDTVSASRKRHLTGEARRDFERAMGLVGPAEIGPKRLPNGNISITSGCPGEYRAQEAARETRRSGR